MGADLLLGLGDDLLQGGIIHAHQGSHGLFQCIGSGLALVGVLAVFQLLGRLQGIGHALPGVLGVLPFLQAVGNGHLLGHPVVAGGGGGGQQLGVHIGGLALVGHTAPAIVAHAGAADGLAGAQGGDDGMLRAGAGADIHVAVGVHDLVRIGEYHVLCLGRHGGHHHAIANQQHGKQHSRRSCKLSHGSCFLPLSPVKSFPGSIFHTPIAKRADWGRLPTLLLV